MERLFTTTLELAHKDLHLPVEEILLEKCKNLYEKKCYGDVFITEINGIVARGLVIFSRNVFPVIPTCDLTFSAMCKKYMKGDIIAVKISDMDVKSAVCFSEEFIVNLNSESIKILGYQKGSKFLAIVFNVSYATGSRVAISAVPFRKPQQPQITKLIVPEKLSEEDITAIELIKKHAKKITGLIKETPKKGTYNIFDLVDMKITFIGPEVQFIIDPKYEIEQGTFSVEPITKKVEGVVKNLAISIYVMLLKHVEIVSSYVEAKIQLENL